MITLYLAAVIIKNEVTSNENGRLYLGMEWAELESFSIRGLKTDDNISCCQVTHNTCTHVLDSSPVKGRSTEVMKADTGNTSKQKHDPGIWL